MRFLAAFLLLTSPLWGQIKLPEKVEGEPSAFITVSAETEGEVVRWLAIDKGLNVFPASLLKSTKSTVVTSAKAGRYRLIAWTAVGGIPSEAVETVVIVGDAPNPGPGPNPNPDPPKPGGPYWIIVLEETGDRTADTSKILNDKKFWEGIESDGSELRVYDDDDKSAAPFVAITQERPALIVMTKSGNLVAVKALPKTTDEIKAVLK